MGALIAQQLIITVTLVFGNYPKNSNMRGLIAFTVLALASVALADEMIECHDHTEGLKWIVCCELHVNGEKEVAVQEPQGMCSCGIDWLDMLQLKITYKCECAGVKLASCSTDVGQMITDHVYEVCCEVGIGEEH